MQTVGHFYTQWDTLLVAEGWGQKSQRAEEEVKRALQFMNAKLTVDFFFLSGTCKLKLAAGHCNFSG